MLAAGIVPNPNQDLVELFKASVNADGFFNEAHPKLRPVDSMVDGLFLAGLCHHPKPLDEAISQAKAAVSRAGVILAKEVMQLDAIKSQVTEKCDGCALCLDVCPYKASEARGVPGQRPGPPAYRLGQGPVQGLRPVRSHLPQGGRGHSALHHGAAQGPGGRGHGEFELAGGGGPRAAPAGAACL